MSRAIKKSVTSEMTKEEYNELLAKGRAKNAKYEIFERAMMYLDDVGHKAPGGFLIPDRVWAKVKSIIGREWSELTDDERKFVVRMIER